MSKIGLTATLAILLCCVGILAYSINRSSYISHAPRKPDAHTRALFAKQEAERPAAEAKQRADTLKHERMHDEAEAKLAKQGVYVQTDDDLSAKWFKRRKDGQAGLAKTH